MKGCRYQTPKCNKTLVVHMFCAEHLAQQEQESKRVEHFNCSRCRRWLRNRPELTDALVGEAFHANFALDATGALPISRIGKYRMVDGTFTIAIVDTIKDGEMRETRRYCPTCASVLKDALLELGFTLGLS